MKKQLLRFLPLIILLIGVGGFMGLVSTRSGWKSVLVSLGHQLLNIAESIAAPERRVLPDLGPLVETLAAPAQTLQIVVDAQGSVRPADEIDLVSQVPGVVVWKAPQLETGGFFARGDVLLRIDPRDFELAMLSADAAVAGCGRRVRRGGRIDACECRDRLATLAGPGRAGRTGSAAVRDRRWPCPSWQGG